MRFQGVLHSRLWDKKYVGTATKNGDMGRVLGFGLNRFNRPRVWHSGIAASDALSPR